MKKLAMGVAAMLSGLFLLALPVILILTNKHVVENADRLKVGIQEDLLFDVSNYRLAKDEDLAILDIPAELQLKALPLRRTPVVSRRNRLYNRIPDGPG
jgi:S1-C subfamily serine protease